MLIRDDQECIPLTRILVDGDIVLLLTPVVAPAGTPQGSERDPFEPLGRRLANHHPWIRHVPYTARGGITSTHVGFIRLAKAVVFVISTPSHTGQSSQVELSEIARAIGEHRPQIIVACCNLQELESLKASFPTVLQLSGYTPSELEAAADIMFRETRSLLSAGPNIQDLILERGPWQVEIWDERRDMGSVHELWNKCMPHRFRLDRFTLSSILCRDGYAMHYIVRDRETREVLGFCATYTTYVDSQGERLIGSLANIIVQPGYRGRGIGLSLHDHALRQLTRTRGVSRLQLGSTFPRLLYGLPFDLESEEWFRRRTWRMDGQIPGSGQEACDWLLRFDEWPTRVFNSPSLTFRRCGMPDFDLVLDIVERESARNNHMGWYDQYAKLANTFHVRDIMLGLEGDNIVAIALTYVKDSGSGVAEDLPWAGTISEDVGGVTCICIRGQSYLVATFTSVSFLTSPHRWKPSPGQHQRFGNDSAARCLCRSSHGTRQEKDVH